MWQPIDTAPDDTEILVWSATQSGTYLAIRKRDGWWTADACPFEWTELVDLPTHWMAIPQPPEKQ